ncbi:asparagine synthase (glutamine-hydrolyzing) [Vitreimonas sp.]|uniref:asparagine synthase (glutamine-hydrolyzing) n=1 Tax=Vitreimonas sp. TaxID=3069702 RepID=UPI002ED8140F
MCGIVGSFNPFGAAASEAMLTRMRDRMVHRGPDGGANWRSSDGHCALGHRRLSIIDLSAAADQPMSNAAGNVTLVFNGEIYNHAELRKELESLGKYSWKTNHSDTEVLLHGYEEYGLAFLDRLYGMFAIGIYDARNPAAPVLHLVRDRVGIKPLYVTRTPKGEWLFGSEIRALVAHDDVRCEMDRTAFWHYLTFIVAPAPLTMFKGVFKLPAGYLVTIDREGRAKARQWWDCRPSAATTFKESDLSFDEAAEELLRLMRQSVKRRMVSDVPFGVLLSGGVDSSLNVALMAELMDRPVSTFTVGYETHEEFNEFEFARRHARRYGAEHHETRISSQEALDFLPHLVELQDEPIADNVCIPLYFLSRLVRQSGTTVVQVGEGADENFLGYWWCDHYLQKHQSVYKPARRRLSLGLLESQEDKDIRRRADNGEELFWGGAVCWWGGLRQQLTPDKSPFQDEIECPIDGLLPPGVRLLDSHAVVNTYLGDLAGNLVEPDVLQKIPYMEMKNRLPEHLLMRVDKMTMAHSIEARVPFLDHDVVNFAMRLPPSYKLRDGVGKRIVKKIAEPYVDNDLVYRKKQGFGAPMDKWFQDPTFGRECMAAFMGSGLRRDGYFDNEFVETLLRNQISGASNWGFHLWTLMNAVFWYERWVEPRARAAA